MSDLGPSILVVEDDNAFRGVLVEAFADRGYEARGVPDAASAVAAARDDSPEMAVVDLRLPDRDGLEVVRELKAIDPTIAIVVLTGYGSIATALESIRLGAAHYLTKPTDADAFWRRSNRAGLAFARGRGGPPVARAGGVGVPPAGADRCDGNVSEAARRLGMHRRSLQRKLTKRPNPV